MSGSIDTSDILVVIDTGDSVNVNLQQPDQYTVAITSGDTYVVSLDLPSTVIATQRDSTYRVADFAVTASYVSGASNSWDGLLAKPVGIVSSSTQVNYEQLQNIPQGIVSSSVQINTGSFVGTFIGTSSVAITASAANSITFIPISASSATSASYATKVQGLVDSSQLTVTTNIPSASAVISSSIKSGIYAATEIIPPALPLHQYSGTVIEYVVQRQSALRTGMLYASWSGSSISYTDVSNTDVGDTTDLSFNFIRADDTILLRVNSVGTGDGAWTVQCLFKLFPNLL